MIQEEMVEFVSGPWAGEKRRISPVSRTVVVPLMPNIRGHSGLTHVSANLTAEYELRRRPQVGGWDAFFMGYYVTLFDRNPRLGPTVKDATVTELLEALAERLTS